VEDDFVTRCSFFNWRKKREISHRSRGKHQTVAPVRPKNMEFTHLIQKVGNILYSQDYDICQDETLKGEINEEKFKQVVFSTVILVTGKINGFFFVFE